MASVTISTILIAHVRKLYNMALEDLISGHGVRKGVNGYTHHALPAYVVSVSAVEAFVNEAFLGEVARTIFKGSPLWIFPDDWLEKMDLNVKLLLIPQLLFDKSFSRDSHPYQDMKLLIKVRNEIVHYKMKDKIPKFVNPLEDRNISLPRRSDLPGDIYPWPNLLSSSEGIRWAHNTSCETVRKMYSFAPSNKFSGPFGLLVQSFSPIPDSYAKDWLRKKGIDADSDYA